MMQATVGPGAPWLTRPEIHRLQLLARAVADTSPDQAAAELQALASQLTERPETYEGTDRTIAMKLLPAVYFGGTDDLRFAAIAGLSMATVSMILFVACANLANMLLSRGVARHKEIGMRLALGASRGRVVRQLLTESVVLATIGGAAGLLVSYWGSRLTWNLVDQLIQIMFLSERPFVASVAPDSRILVFTLTLSVATGLLVGLSPALKRARSDLIDALKDGQKEDEELEPVISSVRQKDKLPPSVQKQFK
jgi:cell division protein FtsX